MIHMWWDIMSKSAVPSTLKGYHKYIGDIQYIRFCWGLISTLESYHEYILGCPVYWRSIPTLDAYHDSFGGCHYSCGRERVLWFMWGDSRSVLGMIITSDALIQSKWLLSMTFLTWIMLWYPLVYSWYLSNVLEASQCADDFSHMSHCIIPMYLKSVLKLFSAWL